MSLWSHRVTSLGNCNARNDFLETKDTRSKRIELASGALIFDVGVQGVLDALIRD